MIRRDGCEWRTKQDEQHNPRERSHLKLPTYPPRTDVLTFELSGLAGLFTALCSILKTPYATLKLGFYRVGP